MDDIRDRFPEAARFMVDGHEVVYLRDDNGARLVNPTLLFTRSTSKQQHLSKNACLNWLTDGPYFFFFLLKDTRPSELPTSQVNSSMSSPQMNLTLHSARQGASGAVPTLTTIATAAPAPSPALIWMSQTLQDVHVPHLPPSPCSPPLHPCLSRPVACPLAAWASWASELHPTPPKRVNSLRFHPLPPSPTQNRLSKSVSVDLAPSHSCQI